jgi:pimeloyl-ACP methyl ester carboxylesterase
LDEVLNVLIPDGKLDLTGLSYGGWLASQYTLHFPERLRKLVLLAPAATVLPVSFVLVFRALLTLLPFGNFRRQFYYWLLGDAVKSGDAGRALVDEAVADWTKAARCFASMPLIPATVLDDKTLQVFSVPCLFMVGEHEKMYSAQKALERLNRLTSQIKTKIIPQAGHDLSFSQPELVTKTILDFLNET